MDLVAYLVDGQGITRKKGLELNVPHTPLSPLFFAHHGTSMRVVSAGPCR